MKETWVKHALRLAATPPDLYSGCRKILRNVRLTFPAIGESPHIKLADAGYTKSKLTMLTKHYLHEPSQTVALELWQKRLGQETYGSVSFTCFNHLIKGGAIDAKRSKRASVFGPCIQSVIITQLARGQYEVDIPYRTTEVLKKFPADLVLIRDVLLAPFGLPSDTPVNFYFAGLTVHPMYFVTVLPHVADPVASFEQILKKDRRFYDWAVKWTARYLCEEHSRGILKFSQALRVRENALNALDKSVIKTLQRYLRQHHPGFTRSYSGDGDDADTDPE
jgi:hypothetical protein